LTNRQRFLVFNGQSCEVVANGALHCSNKCYTIAAVTTSAYLPPSDK